MLVHDRFAATVQRDADRPALRADGIDWSYRELERRVQTLAEQLARQDVGPGERVGIDLGNGADAVVAIWATLRAGAAFVCLDPTTPAHRFAELLADFRPRVLLTRTLRLGDRSVRGATLALVREADASALPGAGASYDLEVLPQGEAFPPPGDPSISIANLVYTSGSTGRPKGVVMSHAAVAAAVDTIAGYLHLAAHDTVLTTLPLSFDYGLYQVLLCGAVGARLVLEPGFGYPGQLLDTLATEGVTTLPGVPSLFHMLLQRPSFSAQTLPTLRRFTNTGAHLSRADVLTLRQRFPDAGLYLMYGLTECKRVSYLPPELVDAHPDSVGLPMDGCEVAIVDSEGRLQKPGEPGELVLRSRSLMLGYWEKPELTAEVVREGPWPGARCLWTGDTFRQDEDGLLYFLGRRDDMFKSRGEKVAPNEVEEVLRQHPAVRAVAVLPEEDPMLDSRIHAFVVLAEGESVDEQALRAFCAHRLEPYKIPHVVHVKAALPTNARGKIDRTALAAELVR